jgi:transitional endoplasmic reticulum ATPase
MAEQAQTQTSRLQVAGAKPQDVGTGTARISRKTFQALNLREGQVLEIAGKRNTAAIVLPPYPEDEGLDVIRLDGLQRGNAGVSIGDYVDAKRADVKPAKRIQLAPAQKNLRLVGSGEMLRRTLFQRPLVGGDVISTSIYQRATQGVGNQGNIPEDLFRMFFEQPAFGLQEIRLRVISTMPRGVVQVAQDTEIELLPEYVEQEEKGRRADVTYDDIGGLGDTINQVREMIELPLKHPELFQRLGIDPPKGILLHGVPGTGKTLLARAVAAEADTRFFHIAGPEIMGRFYGESEQRLREIFQQAAQQAPSIIFIDEIDSIAPKREDVNGEVERRVVAQLLTLMDGLEPRANVVVIGATNRVDALDEALRRPGRFDREIVIGVPDVHGRRDVLGIHTRGMPLAEDVNLDEIARVTYGFVPADLSALGREAAMETLRRLLPQINLDTGGEIPGDVLDNLRVTRDDFMSALKRVQPSALREIMIEAPNVEWDDIGGLEEAKRELREGIELPLKHPDAFRRLGIRPAKGFLLFGPPGTGKTLLAKAIAREAEANFIAAKSSDLLSKWYGESERQVSRLFQRARQVAPTVIFIDEIDSLAPAARRDGRTRRIAGRRGNCGQQPSRPAGSGTVAAGPFRRPGIRIRAGSRRPLAHSENPHQQDAALSRRPARDAGRSHFRLYRRRPGRPDASGRTAGIAGRHQYIGDPNAFVRIRAHGNTRIGYGRNGTRIPRAGGNAQERESTRTSQTDWVRGGRATAPGSSGG